MKPLQITQNEYKKLNGLGGWLILVGIRVLGEAVVGCILAAASIIIFMNPQANASLVSAFAPNLLSVILDSVPVAFSIVPVVFFFLKKKAFVFLYIAQAALTLSVCIVLSVLSKSNYWSLFSASLIWDVIFIAYFFNSKRVAVTFHIRRVEINPEEERQTNDYPSSFFWGPTPAKSIIIVVCLLIGSWLFNTVSTRIHFSTASGASPSSQYYKQLQQQVVGQANNPGWQTAYPATSASRSAFPQQSAASTYDSKYNVLRRGAAAPAAGSYDPLKLMRDATFLGEDMNVVLQNLSPADYTSQGHYEFYPQFDYLGLGWDTNQVFIDAKNGKVFSLSYATQCLNVTKPLDFLYAAETMYDQLVKIYGKPPASNYAGAGQEKTSPMDVDKMLQAMRKGEGGSCYFKWELDGMRIYMSFTNQY